MRPAICALAYGLGLLLVVGGCGSTSEGDDDLDKKPKEQEIEIDELAGKLDPLDDGRIEVPLPKGWTESINEENELKDIDENLARIKRGEIQRLPGIMVKVREYEDFETLGEPDLRKFVRNRNAELPKEKGFSAKLDVKQLSLRGFHGAEYAYKVRIGGRPFERLTLETVVDSRMYTLELTTVNGLREEARSALYAVATGLKFPKMVNKPTTGRRGSSSDEGGDEDDEEDEAANADEAEAEDEAEKDSSPDEDNANAEDE